MLAAQDDEDLCTVVLGTTDSKSVTMSKTVLEDYNGELNWATMLITEKVLRKHCTYQLPISLEYF